jgi:hypothetical protein
MRNFLLAGALGEAAFGVFIFVVPGLGLALLFGSEPVASAVTITRVAGIALVGLGVACYPRGARQGLYGLLTYSVLVMLYLIAVGIGGAAGALLWPAVVVHAGLSTFLIIAARAPAQRN